MKERLLAYLRLEKQAAQGYLYVGLLAMGAGVILVMSLPSLFWQGFASAVIGLAVIGLWTGGRLLRQTLHLQQYLPDLINENPRRYRTEELERCAVLGMQYQRQGNLVLLFVLFGLILALLGGVLSRQAFTLGMGFGLCVLSAVLLVLDLATQWRNDIYRHEVEQFEGRE